MPTLPFLPNFSWAFVRMDSVNISAKFEVRSFTRFRDNRGTQKIGPSLDTPTLPFLQNFSWACVRMDPVNVSAKFAVRSFCRSWDNNDCSFGVRLRTPIFGKDWGSGMVPFERAFVTSYTLSIVTFPPSLCVSEILPLLCSSTPHFPTPPLVFPKFLHVLLGVGGWLLGYEERMCWANCPCIAISCEDFQRSASRGKNEA